MDPTFDALLQQLTDVIEQREKVKDPKKLFTLGAKRYDLEMKLIAMLRPVTSTNEKRANIRVPCMLPAQILHAGVTYTCTVRNISCGGVRLELYHACEIGTQLEVALLPAPKLLDKPMVLPGEVRWKQDAIVGIQFSSTNAATDRKIFGLVLAMLQAQKKTNP